MKQHAFYDNTDNNPFFPELEEQVIARWKEDNAFIESVDQRINEEWVFYDGPPFANGLPHYGHLLTSYVKDVFARYHTMKGERVERRFGWDCHGLPAEMGAEKELGVSGRAAIEKFGIKQFNNHCRSSVMKYTDVWQDYINRAGRWVDFERDYKTMDTSYMESVIWAFNELYKKGLVYESHRVMPYSWAAQTPLSNFETRMDDSYRDREDKAVTVAFKLQEVPECVEKAFGSGVKSCSVLAWTTTPWTLPSNLALAVKGDMQYHVVQNVDGHCFVTALSAFRGASTEILQLSQICIEGYVENEHKNNVDDNEIGLTIEGKSLVGLSYEPLFPYFAEKKQEWSNAFTILEGDFIEEGSGTGIVHLAPGFGEDDQRVCADAGIGIVCPVDEAGCYTNEIFDIGVGHVAKAQDDILLETERFYIKEFQEDDVQLIHDMHNEPNVCDYFNPKPTLEVDKERIADYRKHYQDHGFGKWAVFEKETNEFVGRAGCAYLMRKEFSEDVDMSLLDDTVEVAYVFRKQFWGKGVATEVVPAIMQQVFLQNKIDKIVAIAQTENKGSRRVMEKVGMQYQCDITHLALGEGSVYYSVDREVFLKTCSVMSKPLLPPLSLKGLNVIVATEKCEDEPYNEKQLEKNGLANLRIINYLKLTDQLIKQEDYKHSYPHCWRTDTPLIYKAVPSWYVEVTKFKDRMVELNQNINWIPDHIKDGQFGKWLENARDWSISRNRYWGCPIPIWRTPSGKIKSFGSIEELEKFFYDDESPEYLETENLLLRPFEDRDFDDLYALHSNADVRRYSHVQTGEEVQALMKHYQQCHARHGVSIMAVFDKETGQFVGRAGVNINGKDFTDFEIAYTLVPDVWGKGYAKELARAVVGHFFNYVEDDALYAIVHPENAPSIAVLNKIGMEPVKGKVVHRHDIDHDVYVLSRHNVDASWGMERKGRKIIDLHRPFIDTLTKVDEETGETWSRVTDVFDCWFESGSMPYAQVHYPFENKDWFERHFPADFIVEYVGQTRGWFYTLMVLSTALFDREPFKNCICHGIILDAEGKKLSKRLRNYPDPNEMFDVHGSDAMRWRLISEPVMMGGNLLISKDGSDIRDVVRLTIKPIWNAYHFFSLYANTDGIKAELITDSDHLMDRYILSKLKHAVQAIDSAMAEFLTPAACEEVEKFFETLNNWYIRRNRERYWRKAEAHDEDKQAAYDTLYTCLMVMAQAAAPLLPMITEAIVQGLKAESSVHLGDFPDVSDIADEAQLLKDMDYVRNVCTAALAVRDSDNIRIRQPLYALTVYSTPEAGLNIEDFSDLIRDELNVKNVVFSTELENVAMLKLDIHFPVAGKRLGKNMKTVAAAAKQGKWKEENGVVTAGDTELLEGEYSIKLEPKEAKGAQALASNDAIVVLDLTLTDELVQEGVARDVVRMVQQARKDADLLVSDRIVLSITGGLLIEKAVQLHADYIKEQTLAAEIDVHSGTKRAHNATASIHEEQVDVGFDLVA